MDLYRLYASEKLGIPYDDVTKVQRTEAKQAMFASIYLPFPTPDETFNKCIEMCRNTNEGKERE